MNLRALLFPILLTPAILWAAEEKKPSGLVRCRTFAVGKAPTEELYVKTEGRYEKVSVSTDFIGKSIRTDAKQGIVFYRKQSGPDQKQNDGKKSETYTVFAGCPPDKGSRQLVFFMPGQGNAWNLMAKSDEEGNFPPGTRLVFNLSTHAVAFDFGGTKLVVNARQTALLRPPLKSEQGVAPIKIARMDAEGKWIPFCSSAWRQDANERKIVLVTPYGEDKVSISSIQDTIEPKDAEEQKPEGKRPPRVI